ncbi:MULTISPECIES: hypothetical protein [Roseivirga]|nr:MULTISPECIES: hypothetical protein [Roseivirga]MEC7754946.1 hypothetical protein [Bacteroidota bacterium]
MKKTVTIGLTMLYLITSVGLLFGQHLCMGRVQEKAIFKKVEFRCGMSMEMHKGMEDCCDDEWTLEIVDDEQQVTAFQKAPLASYHLLFETGFSDPLLSAGIHLNEQTIFDTGPPEVIHPDLYLFYHNLKIPSGLQS